MANLPHCLPCRHVIVSFIGLFLTEISTHFLGIDFLHHYNWLSDCGLKLTLDSTTNLSFPIQILNGSVPSLVFITFKQHPVAIQLLNDFISLLPLVNPLHHFDNESRIFPRFESIKFRRLIEDKLAVAKTEFNILLKAGIIHPSKSPLSSPVHLEPKKFPGEWHPCGDLRTLNSITKADRYPLPYVHSLSHKIYSAKFLVILILFTHIIKFLLTLTT